MDPAGLHLVWHGNPTTKKNSQEIAARKAKPGAKKPRRGLSALTWPYVPFIVPGRAYKKALKSALVELVGQGRPVPAKTELWVEAHFYLGARQQPDLDGLFNACADILEAAGVIPNDYWIASWDGSRKHRDPGNPRTEVWVRTLQQSAEVSMLGDERAPTP